MPKIAFDKPNPGQFIFGIVSWGNPDNSREVFIGFYRWCICLTFNSPPDA